MFRIGRPEIDAVARVINSGNLFRIGSELRETLQFESELAEVMGSKYSLCLSSGTSALTAALAALGVGPGDEVIVPGYTFIASAVAVLAIGAIPVIAEIDETLTLDAADVAKKISGNTKAIMPVHIQGFPCDMGALKELADENGLYIVEDACQAVGASYQGAMLGTIGDAGAYSFNYYKILSAGEGGALVTDDRRIMERAIIYHDCGTPFWSYDRDIDEPLFTGANMRVSEITGAILREQLKRLDSIRSDLRRNKRAIIDAVKGCHGLTVSPSNDPAGDLGTTLAFTFDDAAAAERFELAVGGNRPINTGKHVYSNWSPVLEKRGAYSSSMNPYDNPLNAGLNMDYSKDMCPRTLDILARTVYVMLGCDWTEAELNEKIDIIKRAAKL